MIKHTQTIHRQEPTNYLSVSGNSVGLALQGLSQCSISISRFQGIEMEH